MNDARSRQVVPAPRSRWRRFERARNAWGATAILLALLAAMVGGLVVVRGSAGSGAGETTRSIGAATVTLVEQPDAKGVMVTSGGWAYCQQLRSLARNVRFTLLCGRYPRDGYLGIGQRSLRHLDWGAGAYLKALAGEAMAQHARVGGELVMLGVSYSGFGVATLASHHPELRPDRVIVIDSYLDLVARRKAAANGSVGKEIDEETGGSTSALRKRSVSVSGLARLVAQGTRLQVIWSVSPEEAREFKGATCNLGANADVIRRLADTLGRPVTTWVTNSRHGHNLWDHGREIMAGKLPGRAVVFRPGRPVPPTAVCP